MKLLSLTISNFRSINGDKTTISFEGSDIIFLIGKNNAGKSSILHAYNFFVNPKQKAERTDFYGYNPTNAIEIEAVFKQEEGDKKYFEDKGLQKWVVSKDGKYKDCVRFKKIWQGEECAGWTGVALESQKYTYDPATEEFTAGGFGGLEQYLTKCAPTAITIPAIQTDKELADWVKDTFKKTVLKSLNEEQKAVYDDAIEKIKLLQEAVLSDEQIQNLNKSANVNFQKIFPELKLLLQVKDAEPFSLNAALEKEFSVHVNDNSVSHGSQNITTHGHGVLRQAMFNFLGIVSNADVSEGKQFLLLFEEPEIYLHPKAVLLLRDALYELCKDSPFQILCCSHSPALIDISRPHTSIVRVVKQDSKTNFYQVGEDVLASDKERLQMINRFNPHICETFFADKVVLVEGDTEAVVIRDLIARISPKSDIFVLNTGTKNNIPFFQKILTHFNIIQHIIHDCDSADKKSAWALNRKIWDNIIAANNQFALLARRYVFVCNFEDAHGYKHNDEDGKPLSAYKYIQTIPDTANVPVINFVKCILGLINPNSDYNQKDIESMATSNKPDVA